MKRAELRLQDFLAEKVKFGLEFFQTNLFQKKVLELSHKVMKLESEKTLWKEDWTITSHDGLVLETMALRLEIAEIKLDSEMKAMQVQQQHENTTGCMTNDIFAMRLELAEKALLGKRVWDLRDQVSQLKQELAQQTGESLVMETSKAELSKSKKKRSKRKVTSQQIRSMLDATIDPNDEGHKTGEPEVTMLDAEGEKWTYASELSGFKDAQVQTDPDWADVLTDDGY